MTLPVGFDFRNTTGDTDVTGVFAGDPANCFFMDQRTLSGTSNGIAWGWDGTTNNSRDRSNSVDPRLAGMVFVSSGASAATFTVTLPSAGTYDITLALGDHDNQQEINFDILDNGVLLFNVATNVVTSAVNHYIDATGVERTSDTDWVTNNAKKRLTFTTTAAGFRLNVPAANNSCICHLKIEAIAGTPATPMLPRNQSRRFRAMLTR